MNTFRKSFILFWIFLFCLSLPAFLNLLFSEPIKSLKIEIPNNADAPVVRGLVINDLDVNLSWSKLITGNDWCTGNGTQEMPYIIDNIIIREEAFGDNYGIYIRNSRAFFIIKTVMWEMIAKQVSFFGM